MSITHCYWRPLVLLALCGFGGVAAAAEPAAGEKVVNSTAPRISSANEEPRGLLAKRFSTLGSAPETSESRGDALFTPAKQRSFEMASWNGRNTAGPSAV